MKKLYRSNTNRMLFGVAGGVAEYFNMDPTIVRILWVLVALFGGTGVLLYLIAAIIMPQEGNV
ncbi:MAG TPA: PspC domain-containing protein [Oscillospiraceae bacterium]|nr:PspC domain-containing protein [Oscillospiraceae bacterium]